MIAKHSGYFLSGFAFCLLLGRSLTVPSLQPVAARLIALILLAAAAWGVAVFVGRQYGSGLGWAAGAGVLFVSLCLMGVF